MKYFFGRCDFGRKSLVLLGNFWGAEILLGGCCCGRVDKVQVMRTVGGGRWGKDLERVGKDFFWGGDENFVIWSNVIFILILCTFKQRFKGLRRFGHPVLKRNKKEMDLKSDSHQRPFLWKNSDPKGA